MISTIKTSAVCAEAALINKSGIELCIIDNTCVWLYNADEVII